MAVTCSSYSVDCYLDLCFLLASLGSSLDRGVLQLFVYKRWKTVTVPEAIASDLHSVFRDESPLSELSEEQSESEPKRQRGKRKAAAEVTVNVEEGKIINEGDAEGPKRQRRKRKATKEVVMDEDEGNDDEKAAVTHRRKRKIKAATTTIEDFGEEVEKTKKSRRRKTLEEDKVFDIPPIENFLSTTFKGRLGYACLNTMLRKYSTPIFCSRTCRLATIAENGPEHLRTLGLQNIRDLLKLVTWNAQNGIFFMRMSSEMFPFASHPEHGYDLSFADEDLKAVGKTAKELGVRLTSHPGQFTQLGSPREVVVRNAVRDLEYHCEMMDRMGLDQDSVMIIHMGGTFGDEAATLERFKENYTKLLSDSIKRRLVLENDELCYNVDDLLPLCRSLNIPLVFDYHHDWIYPSSRPPRELIPEINQLWYNKGIRPKQHYSEPRPGAVSVMERRAHSDRVKTLPEGLPDDMDLMLECKDKEQAVFYLYRLYNLREVDPRMLRPPAEVESLHTNGRKSTKRARAKAAAKAEAAAAAIETGKGGEADGEDMKMNLEEEVEREAEEHGVPAEETKDAVAEAIGEGELDCGSGDEMPKIEVLPKKVKKRRGKRTTRVETNGNTGQKASRRKGKNVLKQDIV